MEVNTANDNSIYLSPGTVLRSQYRINRVIGQGGFGITYDGTDLKLNMHVAIKEYFPNPVASRNSTLTKEVTCSQNTRELYEHGLKNFLEEARNMARFAGEENFVAVHDYFSENKTAYIIMEFVRGQNLKQYLQQHGRMTLEQTMAIIIPVMNALEKIHANNMIHRDISPSNIMILPDGRVRLLDFGAAKEISFETVGLTTMSSVYKYGYSPIEQQMRGMRQGPFTAIYALCATMYEMLTGRIPAQPSQRTYEGVPLVPLSELGVQISKTQENAILKGLEINGSDRIQSVAELRAALCGERSGRPVRPHTDYTVKRKGIIAILAIIAAILTLILAVIVHQNISFKRDNANKNDEPAAEPAAESASYKTSDSEENKDDEEAPPLQETASEEQGENDEREQKVSDIEAYAVTTRTDKEESSGDIPEDALVYNGHSYYLFDNGMESWAQAQQYCMSRGGDLAVINDAEENELLYQFMLSQGYSEAFFGYSDKENEGEWEWVTSDGSTFEDWGMNDEGEREPNSDHPDEDYAELYVEMIDGHWNDSQFGYKGASVYICEWNTTP